ncbi:MAG: nuclear transport factor 2 family protein [Planctomycetia bacterium]
MTSHVPKPARLPLSDDAAAEQAAQRQLEAYNARDSEAFVAAYHPEIEVFDLPAGTRTLQGREALRTRYGALFAATPALHCRLLHRVRHGCFVVDHEEVTGMAAAERVYAVAIYEVREGLIRRTWFLRG